MPSSVDETQLREDLKLTPTERIQKLEALMASLEQLKAVKR
jgi:hypothetical protein